MAFGNIGKIVKNVGSTIFNRTLSRLTGAGIPTDSRIVQARAKWSGRQDKADWRVRLQIPQAGTEIYQSIFGSQSSEDNQLLAPLIPSRGMFWPLTPTMTVQHSANYNALSQTHSNYPFQAYQNSAVDSINIIGEFPVQNAEDAKHWVATVNFLRTITKMYFGEDDARSKGLKGNPPPIMHLSGYGDHMYNKVPVVVNTFNLELRQGIDYISTKQANTPYVATKSELGGYDEAGLQVANSGESQTWAPTLSNISVLVTPVYSRESIKTFSLSKFARGELSG
jgi:hypothetical protein